MSETPAVQKALESIASGELPKLRHVQSDDRSSPVIEPGTKVKTWDKEGLLHEIEGGVHLKHVDSVNDRSEPKIEEGVTVKPSNRKDLLAEVKAAATHRQAVHEIKEVVASGSLKLHHVEDIHDASKPLIPADAHINTWDKAKFLQEVATPHHLKHVDHVSDRSAPITEGAHVGHNPMPELLKQISSGEISTAKLHHVSQDQVHDASAPVLPKHSSVQSPQK